MLPSIRTRSNPPPRAASTASWPFSTMTIRVMPQRLSASAATSRFTGLSSATSTRAASNRGRSGVAAACPAGASNAVPAASAASAGRHSAWTRGQRRTSSARPARRTCAPLGSPIGARASTRPPPGRLPRRISASAERIQCAGAASAPGANPASRKPASATRPVAAPRASIRTEAGTAGSRRTASGIARISTGSRTQKVDPWPSSLVTPISPPMAPTSDCAIERPRPVPPKRRVVD
ncbi:hypothetical protein AEGHOMDF_0963 [Methylobacterium soli]|nr:hypothetical protein AEGHOMDF_0963 [Methylobacterium soli]